MLNVVNYTLKGGSKMEERGGVRQTNQYSIKVNTKFVHATEEARSLQLREMITRLQLAECYRNGLPGRKKYNIFRDFILLTNQFVISALWFILLCFIITAAFINYREDSAKPVFTCTCNVQFACLRCWNHPAPSGL